MDEKRPDHLSGHIFHHSPFYSRGMPCLAPASFTMVMGTGVVSLATLEMAGDVSWLYWPAQILNFFNYLLFAVLTAWAILSWPKNTPVLRANFEHPDTCALYSASGIAMLVLGSQALRFELGETLAIAVWSAGALITFIFNFGILYRFFMHPGVELAHITPAVFVPVASMVVMPAAGAPICSHLAGLGRELALLACILSLGGGLILYGGLFSILLQRHLLIRPMPDELAPTMWIHLAPIGWSGVSIISLSQFLLPPSCAGAAQLLALLLFGGAFWWFIMAAIICASAIKRKTLVFSLSWWSFIFPVGAITILSGKLDFQAVNLLFPFFWILLCALWLVCVFKTFVMSLKR